MPCRPKDLVTSMWLRTNMPYRIWLTAIVLLLLMIISKFSLPLRSYPPFNMHHLFRFVVTTLVALGSVKALHATAVVLTCWIEVGPGLTTAVGAHAYTVVSGPGLLKMSMLDAYLNRHRRNAFRLTSLAYFLVLVREGRISHFLPDCQ